MLYFKFLRWVQNLDTRRQCILGQKINNYFQKIQDAFQGMVEHIVETGSATEAVKAAYSLGKNGDTVLLSPACASFDLFENYEDRGRQFKKAVREL